MKKRNGFVSNSSSSSFIIDGSFRTSEVAEEMVKIIDREEFETFHQHCRWTLPALSWLQDHPGYDNGIVIPWSCNYDTWIARSKDGRYILIDTCHNHDWHNSELAHFMRQNPYPDVDFYDGRLLIGGFSDTKVFLDLSTQELVNRKDYKDLWERGKEHLNCKHQPNWASVRQSENTQIVDIWCKICNQSGSILLEESDIQWES